MVVTHSPQVTSKGHYHYLVQKKNNNNNITTNVTQLNEKEKIEEIARMVVGVHNGRAVSMSVEPAKINTGIVFKRTDIPNKNTIKALSAGCNLVLHCSGNFKSTTNNPSCILRLLKYWLNFLY